MEYPTSVLNPRPKGTILHRELDIWAGVSLMCEIDGQRKGTSGNRQNCERSKNSVFTLGILGPSEVT